MPIAVRFTLGSAQLKAAFSLTFLLTLVVAAMPAPARAAEAEVVEPASAPSVETAPDALVDGFHQELLALMRSAAPFADRESAIAPVIGDVFDIKSIARVSLGRATWKSLDAQGREQFIGLLTELVSATYASRFKSYNNQRFEVREVTSPKPGRHLVKTELIRDSGETVTLDYYLNKNRVFNVVADGVSDLSLRRADYSAVIKKSGYPALLADIEANIADFRAED